MYYLQSRYYDPAICRFISPDDISYLGANGDLTSYNLYAYCSNNPVNYTDPTGEFTNLLIGAAGFLVCGLISIASQSLDDEASNRTVEDFWKHVLVAATTGAISGMLAASGAPLVVQVVVNGVLGATSAILDTRIDDDGSISTQKYISNAVDGAILGSISGYIGGSGSASKHMSNSFWRLARGKTNFSYYYSQVKKQAFNDGIKAIPSILKASTPALFKMWIKYEYQKSFGD